MGWVTDEINKLLAKTGDWACSLLNSATKLYNRFLDTSFDLITKNINDSTFDDFWVVIDGINSVIVAVASVFLIMMFLYTLVNSSFESKQEVNVNMLVMDFFKLIFCNFMITKAKDIVIGIFTFGTNLATASVRVLGNNDFVITDPNRELNSDIQNMMDNGIVGFQGLFVLMVSLIGAVVIVASAIMIIIEIYKRFFKIFCLIPFASISFSTAVMSDNDGKEIFKGYIKGILGTSLEAMIIVLCMAFCASITGMSKIKIVDSSIEIKNESSSFMDSIFAFDEEYEIREITIDSEEEYQKFIKYRSELESKGGLIRAANGELEGVDEYGVFTYVEYKYPNGSTVNIGSVLNMVKPTYPIIAVLYNELSLGTGLILVIQAVFPMVLTAGAIKEAPSYASRVLGMG